MVKIPVWNLYPPITPAFRFITITSTARLPYSSNHFNTPLYPLSDSLRYPPVRCIRLILNKKSQRGGVAIVVNRFSRAEGLDKGIFLAYFRQ